MTLNEFIELCIPLEHLLKMSKDKGFFYSKLKYDPKGELYLYDDACIGGITGGSCWGSEANQSYSTGNSPSIEKSIDALLLAINKELSFLTYKNIINNMPIETDQYSTGDYYGNRDHHISKYIKIEDLYYYLKEKEVI